MKTYALYKEISFLIAGLLVAVVSFGQTPQAFHYQAVIRDASSELVINQPVGLQISILQGSASGTAVYVETHTPITNGNGLVSVAIGTGSAISGIFEEIEWSSGPYFLKTETDPLGGINYSLSATSQLLSTPYALLAENVVNDPVPVSEVFVDMQSRVINPNWIAGPVFPIVQGFRPGSKVRIDYAVPSRSMQNGWGGLYIEPQISFNEGSSWQSLGSCGYDGNIMVNGPLSIGTYSNFLLVDPDINEAFSVRIRFFYRSYDVAVQINESHDINNISGTAPLMSGLNGTQHYTKVINTEVLN